MHSKLHILKVYNLVNFDMYTPVTALKRLNISINPKSVPMLLGQSSLSPILSISRQPLVCFLPL